MSDAIKPVAGVRLAAVKAGIKKPNRRDLVVLELAEGSHTAAVFTQNRFCAAPVQVAKQHLQSAAPRYLMINTGYANAGTGEQGMDNCLATCRLLATAAGCDFNEVLPFSTGVIGEQFPVAAFEAGLPLALSELGADNWSSAAAGIMTTDTQPKGLSRTLQLDGKPVIISGIAKGSGMINPNMATMLGFIATDAAIEPSLLKQWVSELAERSFNCVTVDGDTSTNDACVLVATGKAGNQPLSDADSPAAKSLFAQLEEVFVALAQSLARDGEGATKFVTVQVDGAADKASARTVGETIAHSPLVKTALFASDPNWGRILAAIGRAPVEQLAVERVDIRLASGDKQVEIVTAGAVAPDYREEEGAAVMAQEEITIAVDLGLGAASQTLWTCDFSYDYVKINAEYRT